jgi:hypothetical protein
MDEINHEQVLIDSLNGDDMKVRDFLVKCAEGLYFYNKFFEKGIKSSCTKCRTTLQTAKKSADEVRKHILDVKKGESEK